jgi:hypothetical protein
MQCDQPITVIQSFLRPDKHLMLRLAPGEKEPGKRAFAGILGLAQIR